MRKFKFVPLLLLVSITFMFTLMGLATAQEVLEKVPEKGVFFSTEEDFVTRGPKPSDGNPIISDGDLLNSAGYVYMRNQELLDKFRVRFDLGLDAADVIDIEKGFVAFSTELDHPKGWFTAGDLLATNGAILPNSVLLAAFDIPRELDLGLDAVHFTGKREAITKFLEVVKEQDRMFWLENPGSLIKYLEEYDIDIWFSTEGTAPWPKEPRFLDGDLLSAATGTIVLANYDALPGSVPAGILDRGVDFGMDAVAILYDPIEKIELLLFSTEINGLIPTFTDGDVLLKGNGVVFHNNDLINAFEPKVKDLGLDAFSIEIKPIRKCRFTRVGGVDVNPTTWDFTNGYVDPVLTSRKDHTFGGWVSIRGVLPPEAVEHRILSRPEGGIDSPILMPAGLGGPEGWRVFCHPLGIWIPVVIDGDGWILTSFWKILRDFCLNPDLIFVNWLTSPGVTPDGKYILSLQVKDAGGNIRTCDKLAIQIDNTRPKLMLSDTHECKVYGPADMPLNIEGAIHDEHFSNYRLTLNSFWMTATTFAEGYYYTGPPLDDHGTIGYPVPVTLGKLDIPSLLGDKAKGGRYTITLYGYDRSLLGAFTPKTNHVAEANPDPADRDDRNWWYRITNFEFYP